jgi:hypothetical protein
MIEIITPNPRVYGTSFIVDDYEAQIRLEVADGVRAMVALTYLPRGSIAANVQTKGD